MKILTKKDSEKIAAALLQMQDIVDGNAVQSKVYEVIVSGIRDIAKATGQQTEYIYALGVTNRVTRI